MSSSDLTEYESIVVPTMATGRWELDIDTEILLKYVISSLRDITKSNISLFRKQIPSFREALS